MLEWLRELHRRSLDQGGEGPMLIDAIRAGCDDAGARVLDVGCGYGRNLRALRAAGIAAIGVEINPAIVAANRRDGLDCVGVDEFDSAEGMFEVILMAHVIEHFAPSDLLRFIDRYLDRLTVGGRLVIATPLMSKYFYDDFDHVKPYQPAGLMMVFGAGAAQVQYYARNRLRLVDLRFRRAPLRISLYIRIERICLARFFMWRREGDPLCRIIRKRKFNSLRPKRSFNCHYVIQHRFAATFLKVPHS